MRRERTRIRRLTSALALLVCCAGLALTAAPVQAGRANARAVPPASDHRVQIRDVSLAGSSGATALTLELDRATSYDLFTLDRPTRVVLDLRDARFAPRVHLPRARGGVEQLRVGSRPHGGLRIVLQLDSLATSSGRVRLPVRALWHRGCGPGPRRTRGATCLVVQVGASDASSGVARAANAEPASRLARTASATATPPSTTVTPRGAAVSRPSATVTRASFTTEAPADVLRPIPAPHAPALDDRDVVIAVDPGHGGKDSGAIGRNGTEEKNVTLAIARALAARSDADPGLRAVLTRDSDVFLLLRDRMNRAREAHADLFVSVHADSIHDPTVSGASVYVLSERGATDEAARWLADRENAADRLGGVPLADKSSSLASLLMDLAQTENISASMTAAQGVLTALNRVGEVRKPRVQQAGFVVLKSPDIPSMLVETAYISNPEDERRLRTAREQHKLADAIFKGLLNYFEQHPPSGTRFARLLKNDPGAELAGAPAKPGAPAASGTRIAPEVPGMTVTPITPAAAPGGAALAARP